MWDALTLPLKLTTNTLDLIFSPLSTQVIQTETGNDEDDDQTEFGSWVKIVPALQAISMEQEPPEPLGQHEIHRVERKRKRANKRTRQKTADSLVIDPDTGNYSNSVGSGEILYGILRHNCIELFQLPPEQSMNDDEPTPSVVVTDETEISTSTHERHLSAPLLSQPTKQSLNDNNKTISHVLQFNDKKVASVSIYPPDLPASEMYNHQYPLLLRCRGDADPAISIHRNQPPVWYLYFENNSTKEDWYLKLKQTLRNNKQSLWGRLKQQTANRDKRQLFKDFKQQLNTIDDSTIWFNAIVGRLFHHAHCAEWLQQQLDQSIRDKLASLRHLPSTLGPITLSKVELGNHVPIFHDARLVDISDDGLVNVEISVEYIANDNGVNVELQTSLRMQSLVELPISVAVQLKRISGRLLLRIKPPPSDRMWIGFLAMPQLDVAITPSVADQLLPSLIERKVIKPAIKDSMVLPNMMDFYLPGSSPAIDGTVCRLLERRCSSSESINPYRLFAEADITTNTFPNGLSVNSTNGSNNKEQRRGLLSVIDKHRRQSRQRSSNGSSKQSSTLTSYSCSAVQSPLPSPIIPRMVIPEETPVECNDEYAADKDDDSTLKALSIEDQIKIEALLRDLKINEAV